MRATMGFTRPAPTVAEQMPTIASDRPTARSLQLVAVVEVEHPGVLERLLREIAEEQDRTQPQQLAVTTQQRKGADGIRPLPGEPAAAVIPA